MVSEGAEATAGKDEDERKAYGDVLVAKENERSICVTLNMPHNAVVLGIGMRSLCTCSGYSSSPCHRVGASVIPWVAQSLCNGFVRCRRQHVLQRVINERMTLSPELSRRVLSWLPPVLSIDPVCNVLRVRAERGI